MERLNTKPYELPSDAIWLITGCSSGIGLQIATLISSKPSQRLIATARNPASLSYLPDDDAKILKLALDVTSATSVDAALASAAEHFGPGFHLDVVVNNAGYSLSGDTETATEAQMHLELETLFFGTARVTTRAIANMRQPRPEGRPRGGLIFNVSSLAGLCAFPGHAFYHAGKHAVEGFSEAVAREMHPDWNIHICILEPGAVKTNFEGHSKVRTAAHPAYAAPDMPARQLETYVDAGLRQGMGLEPAAVARTVYDLASRGQPVPLRVPMGATAWKMSKAKFEALLVDWEKIRLVSAMGEVL